MVLDYGAGNVHSAAKALSRAGMTVHITRDPADLTHAAAVVVPGQGHFGQVMTAFEQSGFHAPLVQAVQVGLPMLGICVGMQMLFEGSEEAPGVAGLGLLRGTVRKFQAAPGQKVPQMGWNSLRAVGDSPLVRGLDDSAYAYFVHSYYVPVQDVDAGITAGAVSEYGLPFWSVLSQGNIHATQFHPEKSGEVGLAILRRFQQLL